MRKLLNTLYVTTPEAYLTKDGENVVIRVKEKDIFRIPVLNIEGIVTFGYIGASPALMKMCAERNVGLCFLSANGQFQGRVSGPTKGNVLLRRTQYRIADDANKSLEISRLFIAGKIANSRTVIDRFKRDHISSDKQLSLFLSVSEKLKRSKNQALVAESSDTLRGIEGEAATTYFSVFNQMIISQCEDFPFNGMNRRPPKDKVNALLSFVFHSRYLKTQEYLSCGYSLPSLLTVSLPDRTVRFLLSEVPLYTLLKNHEAQEIYDKHFPLKLLSVLLSVLP